MIDAGRFKGKKNTLTKRVKQSKPHIPQALSPRWSVQSTSLKEVVTLDYILFVFSHSWINNTPKRALI